MDGEIVGEGGKKEVLEVVCGRLVRDEEVSIEKIGKIVDVKKVIELVGEMGVKVCKWGSDGYSFEGDNVKVG